MQGKTGSRGKTEPMFDQLVPLNEYHDKLVTALAGGAGPDAGWFKE